VLLAFVVWNDLDELRASVNDTEYGLAAYVFGELAEALHLGEYLETQYLSVDWR
jgi:succinate-semialdehyde dehydrogenase/glutarate-semialdehyde dehydrogenase